MIFIDSNIPMYVIGTAHPNKETALLLLERLINDGQKLVTNAEVFQEILHRYKAIHRIEAIQPAIDCLENIVDEVFPVTKEDVIAAKENITSYCNLSSRDALHVSHMKKYKIQKILSFDRGFDQISNLERLYRI